MLNELKKAEKRALKLYSEAERRGYFSPNQTEKDLNNKLYKLAEELLGIKKYWHKRIVRAGKNTLFPYKENPANLQIKSSDILFIDFGPVFEEWEADIGRTYILGTNKTHLKLKKDVEEAWNIGKRFYDENKFDLTGANFYNYTANLAQKYGWQYGGPHCGHLIGNFPHEKILGDEVENYIHPNNHQLMSSSDRLGKERHWIYEIHFVDTKLNFGGFFEQLVS